MCNSPIRVSFLKIPTRRLSYGTEVLPSTSEAHDGLVEDNQFQGEITSYIERICFNIGREIYVFDYNRWSNFLRQVFVLFFTGFYYSLIFLNITFFSISSKNDHFLNLPIQFNSLNRSSEAAKPVDKRVYKGTFPTCHDFKQVGATLYSCSLIVGFSAGQIQLVNPSQKEVGTSSSKLFNEDRIIDKTAVTCLKWVPSETYLFAASHFSGNIYVCLPKLYVYVIFKFPF